MKAGRRWSRRPARVSRAVPEKGRTQWDASRRRHSAGPTTKKSRRYKCRGNQGGTVTTPPRTDGVPGEGQGPPPGDLMGYSAAAILACRRSFLPTSAMTSMSRPENETDAGAGSDSARTGPRSRLSA